MCQKTAQAKKDINLAYTEIGKAHTSGNEAKVRTHYSNGYRALTRAKSAIVQIPGEHPFKGIEDIIKDAGQLNKQIAENGGSAYKAEIFEIKNKLAVHSTKKN